MSDTIKPNVTLAGLDAEAEDRPFILGLPGGKRVTFPDPSAMAWDEAENFLTGLSSDSQTISETLKAALSEADYNRLIGARLTLRQLTALMREVSKHYESILGTVPNGGGSTR